MVSPGGRTTIEEVNSPRSRSPCPSRETSWTPPETGSGKFARTRRFPVERHRFEFRPGSPDFIALTRPGQLESGVARQCSLPPGRVDDAEEPLFPPDLEERDEIPLGRDPRRPDHRRFVELLSDGVLEPPQVSGLSDDGELLAVRGPVGTVDVLENFARRAADEGDPGQRAQALGGIEGICSSAGSPTLPRTRRRERKRAGDRRAGTRDCRDASSRGASGRPPMQRCRRRSGRRGKSAPATGCPCERSGAGTPGARVEAASRWPCPTAGRHRRRRFRRGTVSVPFCGAARAATVPLEAVSERRSRTVARSRARSLVEE